MVNKEFKVNKYITLKLEGNRTVIYVLEERFDQCKFLLLNIPVDEISSFDDLLSIDDATERLGKNLEREQKEISIPPEVEFWGHSSNLQVWDENDYDTRLLHSNLAFPLLKKLTEAGDPKAKRVFQEEIAKRLESKQETVITYLVSKKYIDFLPKEYLDNLINGEIKYIISGGTKMYYLIHKNILELIPREIIIDLLRNNEYLDIVGTNIFSLVKDLFKDELEQRDMIKWQICRLIEKGKQEDINYIIERYLEYISDEELEKLIKSESFLEKLNYRSICSIESWVKHGINQGPLKERLFLKSLVEGNTDILECCLFYDCDFYGGFDEYEVVKKLKDVNPILFENLFKLINSGDILDDWLRKFSKLIINSLSIAFIDFIKKIVLKGFYNDIYKLFSVKWTDYLNSEHIKDILSNNQIFKILENVSEHIMVEEEPNSRVWKSLLRLIEKIIKYDETENKKIRNIKNRLETPKL